MPRRRGYWPLRLGALLPLAGLAALVALGALAHVLGDGPFRSRCPLPYDVDLDATPCFLALDGLGVSLAVGLGAALVSTAVGLAVAFLARLAGGGVERWIVRACDAFFALPDVLVLLVLQSALASAAGDSPFYRRHAVLLMVLSLSVVGWAGPARMLRDRLATLERAEYVTAARALGGSRGHVLRAHLWPALRPFALALFLNRVPSAMLAESTVSFIGIGDPNLLSLGRYLARLTRELQYVSPATYVLPVWALFALAVLCATGAARALAER